MSKKLRILNKHFCEETIGSQRRIVPNPFELGKQWCIMQAGKVGVELPYFSYCVSDYQDTHPHLESWVVSLSQHNPPYDRIYRVDPKRFRELVETLDFSKPFDQAAVDAIWNEFRGEPVKRETPDAAELLEAELFQEDK